MGFVVVDGWVDVEVVYFWVFDLFWF